MDAFAIALELLGDVPLTAGQLTQLRAIDHKYWQAVHALVGATGQAPTEAETAVLRAGLERDVRALAPAGFVSPVANIATSG